MERFEASLITLMIYFYNKKISCITIKLSDRIGKDLKVTVLLLLIFLKNVFKNFGFKFTLCVQLESTVEAEFQTVIKLVFLTTLCFMIISQVASWVLP